MQLQGLARRVRGSTVTATRLDGPLASDIESPDDRLDAPAGDREGAALQPPCGHQLVEGHGRCPGCGVLVIAGVRVRTAAAFVLAGCVVGMLGGALVAGAVMAPRLAAGDAAIVANGAGESGGANGQERAIWLPPGVAGGLRQIAAVNERLAASSAGLKAELAGRRRAVEIAAVLRRVATDARIGGDAARRLGAWGPAADLATDASRLYASVMAAAADGLAAPIARRAAYATAARATRTALRDLPDLAAATREVALLAGVELPGAAAP